MSDRGSQPDRARLAGQVTSIDQALWRQFVEAATVEQFGTAWLGLLTRMIDGASAGIVVLKRDEVMAPVAAWPRQLEDPQRFTRAVQRALEEGKGVVTRGEAGAEPGGAAGPFRLAFPVVVDGATHGVAALQVGPRGSAELQSAMRQLQWGVGWLQNWILRRSADPHARAGRRLTAAVELTARVLEEPRFQPAATAAATELATRLDCDRVSVGFVRRGRIKVRALSHSAQFGKEMNLIRSIGAAMEEAVDQQAVVLHPEPGDKQTAVAHAHGELARLHGDGAVCTIPFLDHEGRAYGALTLERAVDEPFDEPTVELCEGAAALLGPILEEKRRNDRLLVTKAGESLWIQLQRLFGARHTGRKLFVAAAVALAVFFSFARGDYRVTAPTTLEGEVRRVVTAPFDGFVFEAQVRGGDIVREGQTMCRLDVRDLRLEYSRWSSEREQYMLERRRAMSEGDRAAANVLGKKMNQAEAQIALLDAQIARAHVVAPFDGLVVSGDLSQQLGAPLETGQVLFEVAPLDSYRLKLEVDESRVRDLAAGQGGKLVLTAMPDQSFPFTVTRVTPVAVAEEGRNYFVVEARLDQASERLRPGMEGFSKVDIERRRLIWIWTRDIVDWARLWAWSYLP